MKNTKSGHRFQCQNATPFLKAGLPIPTTCAGCGQAAGAECHTKKGR